MTTSEYNELKYKIITRYNQFNIYLIIASVIISQLVSLFLIHFEVCDCEGGLVFGIISFTVCLLIGKMLSPWSEVNTNTQKNLELDKLYKSKASYEEALTFLGLEFEPPKD